MKDKKLEFKNDEEVWKDITDTVLSVVVVLLICIVIYTVKKFM